MTNTSCRLSAPIEEEGEEDDDTRKLEESIEEVLGGKDRYFL